MTMVERKSNIALTKDTPYLASRASKGASFRKILEKIDLVLTAL